MAPPSRGFGDSTTNRDRPDREGLRTWTCPECGDVLVGEDESPTTHLEWHRAIERRAGDRPSDITPE